MANRSDPKHEVASLLARAAALSSTAAETAGRGGVAEALRLEERAERLRARARRAVGPASGSGATPAKAAGDAAARIDASTPARDIAISVLNELEVPAAPRSVAEYAAVRYGSILDSRAMASLRRDEQRSWRSGRSVRAVYIVPALEGHRFLPLRGNVALS
jgi:hypothetical protein